jgi:tetratricopeptide (TPR) repeat protein
VRFAPDIDRSIKVVNETEGRNRSSIGRRRQVARMIQMGERVRGRLRFGRFVAIILLATATPATFGIALWSWSVAKAARDAHHELTTGRYARAQEQARYWLRLRPGSSDAHYVIARAALALGQADVFRENFRRAIDSGLSQPRRSLLLALVDIGRGRHAGSEPSLIAAITAGDDPDPQLDEALARVYLETFHLREAEAVLDRWAAEAPDDPKPYLFRAEVDRRVRRGSQALEADYRRALERSPRSPAARLGLADVLREMQRHDEARSEYALYLELSPNDPAGHLGAAQVAQVLGDDPAAKRHLDRALALDPRNAKALKLCADNASRRGDAPSALDFLDRAIALTPSEIDLRYSRSLLLFRMDRRDEAAQEQAVVDRLRSENAQLDKLNQVLIRTPDNDELKAKIGMWMLEHGHEEEARRWAEDVRRRIPTHPLANQILVSYYQSRREFGLANYHQFQRDSHSN